MPRKKKETLVHLDLETMSQKVNTKRNVKSSSNTDNSIGGILKQAREKQKMSVAEVSQKLRIKEMYLEALENGCYYVFPGLAYGVGFLRTYALFLGLDAEEMVEKFHKETSSIKVAPVEIPLQVSRNLIPSWKTIAKGICALLVVYLVWYIIVNLASPSEDISMQISVQEEQQITELAPEYAAVVQEPVTLIEDVKEEKEPVVMKQEKQQEQQKTTPVVQNEKKETVTKTEKAVESPVTAQEVVPTEKNVQMKENGFLSGFFRKITPAKTYGAKNARLSLKATGEVWVSVSSDNQVVFEDILYDGDTYNVDSNMELKLTTANAGALTVYIDDAKIRSVGAEGTLAKDIPLTIDYFK